MRPQRRSGERWSLERKRNDDVDDAVVVVPFEKVGEDDVAARGTLIAYCAVLAPVAALEAAVVGIVQ